MGQREILDLLKKNKVKWFTANQLKDILDVSNGALSTSLKKLRETNEVDYQKLTEGMHYRMVYRHKMNVVCRGCDNKIKNYSEKYMWKNKPYCYDCYCEIIAMKGK